jgi:hypothetical protein
MTRFIWQQWYSFYQNAAISDGIVCVRKPISALPGIDGWQLVSSVPHVFNFFWCVLKHRRCCVGLNNRRDYLFLWRGFYDRVMNRHVQKYVDITTRCLLSQTGRVCASRSPVASIWLIPTRRSLVYLPSHPQDLWLKCNGDKYWTLSSTPLDLHFY